MNVKGIAGLTGDSLKKEIENGGRFVIYQYCVSILIMTFKRPSSIIFVKANGSRFLHGLKYSLVSLLFGWWGFPWGPIYTISSIGRNCGGGKDVTVEVLEALTQDAEEAAS